MRFRGFDEASMLQQFHPFVFRESSGQARPRGLSIDVEVATTVDLVVTAKAGAPLRIATLTVRQIRTWSVAPGIRPIER